VPRDCVKLLTKVPDPGAQEGQDLGDIAAGYKGAWVKANKRLGRGAACIEHQADAIERGAR
jgi:type I restriction-modification system DNA methylase subunit